MSLPRHITTHRATRAMECDFPVINDSPHVIDRVYLLKQRNLAFTFRVLLSCLFALVVILVANPRQSLALDAVGNPILVALGDSYSSGEGIEPFYDQNLPYEQKTKSYAFLAHRSVLGWPGRLELTDASGVKHKMTVIDTTDTGNADEVLAKYSTSRNFYFAAASGAETRHMNSRQEKAVNTGTIGAKDVKTMLPAQLDVFKDLADENIDYVTLTLGGNDIDFVGIISEAGMGSGYLNPDGITNKLNESWKKFKHETRDKLKQAYKDISAKTIKRNETASQTSILVAGYPTLLDWDGKGALFTVNEARQIDNAVHEFNSELKALIAECRAAQDPEEHIENIYFVDVEPKFYGHEAYSDDAYINEVTIPTQAQDLIPGLISAYSIHPNQKGAQAYADCVQAMIDQIEEAKATGTDFGKYYDTPSFFDHDEPERQIALTLDVSGSMYGNPLDQTKIAALKFIDSTTENASANAAISLVSYSNNATLEYDSSVSTLAATAAWQERARADESSESLPSDSSQFMLKNDIRNLSSGGGTNIESGLSMAYEQVMKSSPDRRIIVLMSDGEANDGKTGEDLVEYAQSIKDDDVLIYALGFYQSGSSGAATLEQIASDGCYYQIDDANQLRYFFGDIADALNGTKFMYVRIACPVDVKVSSSSGTLNSADADLQTRATFGSLTFEDPEDGSSDPVKVLRLKEGESYDIEITGTGTGTMDYTIGFADDEGRYSDMRSFENVSIEPTTKAVGVAEIGEKSVLRVDNDGDGTYDDIYQASANSAAERVDNASVIYAVIAAILVLVALAVLLYVRYCVKTWRRG